MRVKVREKERREVEVEEIRGSRRHLRHRQVAANDSAGIIGHGKKRCFYISR